MADLLVPGLWWLHGTLGSNVYLVEADDGRLALVDTGFASSARAILDEVTALGKPLSAILLTHKHRDHTGAAPHLHGLTGATLCMGRGDCLEHNGRWYLRSRVGRSHVARFLFAQVRHEHPQITPVDLALEGEREVLPGIRAVPVPGHTAGSYCYVVDRLGAAFVGDLVISHGGELTRSMRMANQDDERYLRALREFGAVAPEAGLPGHGQPVMRGFGEALRELAALPRRPASPRNFFERAVRMARFSRGMSRRRAPSQPGPGKIR